MGIGLTIFGIIAAVFWIWQFLSLMTYSEANFPDKHDKLIWAAALIVLNALGALAFFIWKIGSGADDAASKKVREILHDATKPAE
ncbi:MAG: hypothetical protein AAGI37_18775 [Planctomycetota bacterium]